MLPEQLSNAQLTPASFNAYPPEARQLAVKQIALLQRLPLAFLPLLLRELIVYDWKFPAERADLDRQFAYLGTLAPGPFQAAMSAFAQLKLTRELEQTDWVNSPAVFSEKLSAHLWATHQIDAFRAAEADGRVFSVVITDLGMPRVDGRKVAAAIKETSPETPVIMLTGWGQRLVAEADIPPHVDRVLNKPPKLRELREALALCISSPVKP